MPFLDQGILRVGCKLGHQEMGFLYHILALSLRFEKHNSLVTWDFVKRITLPQTCYRRTKPKPNHNPDFQNFARLIITSDFSKPWPHTLQELSQQPSDWVLGRIQQIILSGVQRRPGGLGRSEVLQHRKRSGPVLMSRVGSELLLTATRLLVGGLGHFNFQCVTLRCLPFCTS